VYIEKDCSAEMTIPPDAQAAKSRHPMQCQIGRQIALQGAVDDYRPHVVVIFGASGNLAKRRIFPTLWRLFRDDLLPKKVNFVGYAWSSLTMLQLAQSFEKYCEVKYTEKELFVRFMKKCAYIQGSYNETSGYKCLQKIVNVVQADADIPVNRLFYLALPPSMFVEVTAQIKEHCMDEGDSWSRIIVENISGLETKSNVILSDHLAHMFKPNQIYRVNHYLCKDIVPTFLILRFGNALFDASWNRNSIESVAIMHKEKSDMTASSACTGQYDIIRDIMSNHLLQILSLVAIEQPASLCADDVRDEKVKVMKAIGEISTQDVVLGQYQTENGSAKNGFLVNRNMPTFAQAVVRIKNDRWDGVPFILSSGTAMNETSIEVRVLFKPIKEGDKVTRVELVIGVHPNDIVRLKMQTEISGMEAMIEDAELNVNYAREDKITRSQEPYERLFIDVFKGSQINLVREDELNCAWRYVH
ncbi:hypothetical protein PRIPAC_96961, partial [Pristionchus pacificus]|uniref:Glucose-6-phosphate 1-dehydrogenase n=1 Tax=Pristionchus pacificus TaxID=54126 RepID=A0A2A6D213_PRIPA